MRRLGDITLDMEPLLEEMCDDHDLQHGEVIYLIYAWLKIHRPENVEEYSDGSHPQLDYS